MVDQRLTPQQVMIRTVLDRAGRPMQPREIAAALNAKPDNIRKALLRMRGEGRVNHCPGIGWWSTPHTA
jgi:DNA-binding GntR family transcriptional regulator